MIDLYLPPKPAIIQPAPLVKASGFLPGWFPAPVMALERAVEATYRFAGHDTDDDPPWEFASVPIGDAHPLRYIVVYVDFVTSTATVVNVDGVAATFIDIGASTSSRLWWIKSIPTGTTCDLQVAASGSLSVHCSVEVWTLLYLKSATPIDTWIHANLTDDPKNDTVSVEKGGAVLGAASGSGIGSTMTFAFGGGLSTAHSGSTVDGASIGAGQASPVVDNAAFSVTADRSGTANNYRFSGLSFR